MQFLRRSLVGLFLLSVTFGVLAFAGSTFWSALQVRLNEEDRQRPVRERVFAVNVVTVTPGPETPVMTAFGSVQSRRTLDVRASAAGRVAWLSETFEDGAAVKAGDLLARVDPTDAQAALDVARTELLEAEAELRDAERNLDLARDDLAQAEAQGELRQAAKARQEDLLRRGVGTEAAVETAALSEAGAMQAVLSRRQALAQAEKRVDTAGTGLQRRQIAVANAERDLADTEITAAFDGTLAEVTLVEGGLVTNNEKIAQLIDPSALEVAFRVSTAEYTRLID
ncbi:MAG: HlyD family efflux transporter periplasmic adaptor subunit, partial [Pseudomonadota bacterium]